jgi:hypothetical protein
MAYNTLPIEAPVANWPLIKDMLGGADANIAGSYAAWHMSPSYNYCAYCQRSAWPSADRSGLDYVASYDEDSMTLLHAARPNDMDIFTYTNNTYDCLVARFHGLRFKKLKESEFCTSWEATGRFQELGWSHFPHLQGRSNCTSSPHTHSITRPKLPIQIIKPILGNNVEDVLDTFDFYLSKFAILDDKSVLAHDKALGMLCSKQLVSANPERLLDSPFFVLARYMKYVQKGYKVNYMDLYRLVATAQATDLRWSDLKIEAIKDLVVKFGAYIHNDLGSRGEDFRVTMETAYKEWLDYILSKKL